MRALRSCLAVLALAVALGASFEAKAAPISPGFDLFSTGPSVLPIVPPGASNPPVNVTFQGLPLGPGNTDTIVQRTGSLADGATGTIPAQVIALSLKSTSPADIGGSFFDVFVTINAIPSSLNNAPPGPPQYDPLTISAGIVTITGNGALGGPFSASYTVNADVILTAPGGDPTNPSQVVSHFTESGFTESISGTWHPPQPCIPNSGPGTGVCASGGFTIDSLTATAGPLQLAPAVVPHPPTVLLFGSGVIGLAVVGRRRAQSLGESPSPVDPTGPEQNV